MTPCPRCGRDIPADAAFCAACGSPKNWQPAPPLGQQLVRDLNLHQILILVGAIAAFVVAGFILLMSLLVLVLGQSFANEFRTIPDGPGPWMMGGFMTSFMALFGILDVVWGFLALKARRQIQQGQLREGGKLAIIVGALMTVLGVGLLGLLVLIPGILVFSRAGELAPTAPSYPPPR